MGGEILQEDYGVWVGLLHIEESPQNRLICAENLEGVVGVAEVDEGFFWVDEVEVVDHPVVLAWDFEVLFRVLH